MIREVLKTVMFRSAITALQSSSRKAFEEGMKPPTFKETQELIDYLRSQGKSPVIIGWEIKLPAKRKPGHGASMG